MWYIKKINLNIVKTNYMNNREQLFNSIKKLIAWIERNGYRGYDPFDIKSLPWVVTITRLGNRHFVFEIFRELIFEFFYTFPLFSRRLFKITPQINAKAMGLLATTYLDLYKVTNESRYIEHSRDCMNWLENNRSKNCPGFGWGYPFDWQSTNFIPRYTPNGVVTTAVADAFWTWYQYTKNLKDLDICKQICYFLVSLPVDRISADQICFSYTPLFINHVHNLNLFVAEFLLKIGLEINQQKWITLAKQAINYSISNQAENGSFDYNGPPEKPKHSPDNYHTGFMLRSLYSIWKLTDDKKIYLSLKKCYDHYINHFFENEMIPKLLPDRIYNIDIHSCAESIYCLSVLSKDFPEGKPRAIAIANWTIMNLQDKSGYFYYGILKSRIINRPYVSKIAYMRWGQAWMLKALSNIVRLIESE
jgi:hypothetical protein